jgi:hypothetical protein
MALRDGETLKDTIQCTQIEVKWRENGDHGLKKFRNTSELRKVSTLLMSTPDSRAWSTDIISQKAPLRLRFCRLFHHDMSPTLGTFPFNGPRPATIQLPALFVSKLSLPLVILDAKGKRETMRERVDSESWD